MGFISHPELTETFASYFRLAVQRLSDSVLVLGHDAEHILMTCHQVLYSPDTFFGFVGNGHPGLPVCNTPPDDVICDFRSTIIFWWQPRQCNLLSTNLLKLDWSRGRTGTT